MMITREDIRQLAQFQCDNGEGCALSFYFQPQTPKNKSHKEEAILAKDLVRNAIRDAEKHGKNGDARADLEKIYQIAGNLRGNQARAKAIFACKARNVWKEFDLPPILAGSQLFVNQRFHLNPLAALLGAQPRLFVALVDRQRARLFDLRLDELAERKEMFRPLPRKRSDGYSGYDGGHSQRRVDEEAMHHFKAVAEYLKEELEKGAFENLIIGCHEMNWHDFEPCLHPYLKKRLLGHFAADVATFSNDDIRDRANRILRETQETRRHEMVKQVLGQGHRNGPAVTGLRRVLRSLQLGEVQSLLLGENFHAHAVECTKCGHLDSHMVGFCPVCGHETRELTDVCDAMIPLAIRRDIELFYVKDPDFDRVGNIGALLRFRAEGGKPSTRAIAG